MYAYVCMYVCIVHPAMLYGSRAVSIVVTLSPRIYILDLINIPSLGAGRQSDESFLGWVWS